MSPRFYALVATLCGLCFWAGTAIAAPDAAGVVNIYSSRHYDVDEKLYALFTEKTGIRVQHTSAGAVELLERIKQEGARSPADLLISVDIGNIWRAKEAGVFAPVLSAPLQAAIPAALRDTDNQWFGISKRARVIFYNKAKVPAGAITRYEDLAAEQWRGKLLLRPASNVYNQSLTASVLASAGENATLTWVQGMIKNLARPVGGNDVELIQAVAEGKGEVTIANTYYYARMIASKKPEMRAAAAKVGWVFPNQGDRGAHINISGIGLLKSAKNRDNAIKFMEFMTSPEAQEIFASANNEYPIVEGIAENTIVHGLGSFKADSVNLSAIGQNSQAAIAIMDRGGWK